MEEVPQTVVAGFDRDLRGEVVQRVGSLAQLQPFREVVLESAN